MLNQVFVAGKLLDGVEELEAGRDEPCSYITLAVPRGSKDMNGDYCTDLIDCRLSKGIAESTAKYCKRGDLLGIRGRIQGVTIETEDRTEKNIIEVVAETITVLPLKRKGK